MLLREKNIYLCILIYLFVFFFYNRSVVGTVGNRLLTGSQRVQVGAIQPSLLMWSNINVCLRCVCSSTRERGSMCVVKSSRCRFQHMPMPKALWRWSGGSNRAMWCWCTARRKRWPTWSVPSYRISAFLRLIRPTARLSLSTARCAYLYRFQRHCCRCAIVELSFCFVDCVVCVCVCMCMCVCLCD